ncbi:NAD(P)/FAD-dependent oxidoreductase [Micromonospora sp. NPDC005161]
MYPTRQIGELSWWLDQAQRQEVNEPPAPALDGNEKGDVCIVGGGYTGLWTALQIKEADPSADVVLIEANECGSGASGRNGGFVLSWWAKLATLVKLFGPEQGPRLAQASADSVYAIGEFCQKNGIDAHYRRDGWLWAATNEAQLGAWTGAVEAAAAHGYQPFEAWTPEEVAARAGSAQHVGGVFEASAATVQPALLARGLRRVAIELGVRIYERTPMVSLSQPRSMVVHTPRGSVTAEKVVLATNAWMARHREIAKALVIVSSDMVVTKPIPELLNRIGRTDGLAISDSRMLVNYYQATRDHRLAFGHGGGSFGFGRRVGSKFEGPSPRRAAVVQAMTSLYPTTTSAMVDASWTGPIDRSISSLPFFGRLGGNPRVLYGVGYSGNGVGPTHLGGQILASMALERDDEWRHSRLTQGPVGHYPPEPAKVIGGVTLRAVLKRKEDAEDRGKVPGPLTRSLSLLAPPGLVPVRRPVKTGR